ncbi:sensor histidine kinase [Ramlibacter sp. PS3R-8]|uniref:sensor histidine kinase n=1 Tax=Ramlibacter sp. PS3R-8 TaxID=3133437 RepID=UPI00309CEFF1
MREKWQLVVHMGWPGLFRFAFTPATREAAVPYAQAAFGHAASPRHADPLAEPEVDERRGGMSEPWVRTWEHLVSAGRDLADVRLPRLRTAASSRRALGELLISAQENERRRIAFDLHDGIGQSLSLLKLSAEKSARLMAQGAAKEAEEALRQLRPRIDEALAEVRHVAMELCPPMLEDLGLLPTLSWFFREFESASAGVVLVRTIKVAEHDVPRPLHVTVFRILQEALHNVTKHANAGFVQVRLWREGGTLRLSIEDDGCGFDPHAARASQRDGAGRGLLSMRERARVSGASYRLHSAPGDGTTISISWPEAKLPRH